MSANYTASQQTQAKRANTTITRLSWSQGLEGLYRVILGLIGIMENKMETAKNVGIILGFLQEVQSAFDLFSFECGKQARACFANGHLSGSQNWGPFFVPLNITCCNIFYNHRGLIILRTTHVLCTSCDEHLPASPSNAASISSWWLSWT